MEKLSFTDLVIKYDGREFLERSLSRPAELEDNVSFLGMLHSSISPVILHVNSS